MPIEHKNGILRDVGVSDNYMPEEYSDTNAYNIVPFPRLYVKLPARIVDEHSGDDGSATFEIDTNVFDDADIRASIDGFATYETLSAGIVSFTDLAAGEYTLQVRGYRTSTTYVETKVFFRIYFIGQYQTKYTLTFKDIHDDETFTVRIKERGYDGSVLEYCSGASPAVIDWGFDASSEIYGYSSMPSKCSMSLIVQEEGDYEELYDESDPFKFKIEILEGAGLDAVLYWQGWISGNTYQRPLRDVPYQINLVAFCGIGLLSNIYAASGTKFTGRTAWNHDSISLTDVLWAIRRELRLSTTSSSSPGPFGPNKILYFDHVWPFGHDQDYPAFFSEKIDLRKLVKQDLSKDEPTTLIELLSNILAGQFCKLIPYAGRWYIVPTTYYEDDSFAGILQSTRTTFTPATINNILPVVDGINADPAADFSWRENNQVVSYTETFNTVVISHSNTYNGSIPIKPWFGSRKGAPGIVNTFVDNNQPGWFIFYEQVTQDNPSPILYNLQYQRVLMSYAVGIETVRHTIPGYWAIEPVRFKRHSNSLIESSFLIEFTSYNFDSDNLVTLRLQIFCAGYYLDIPVDDNFPTWIEMDVAADTFDTYTQVLATQDVSFADNRFDKKHKIQTPIVPAAILNEEHFSIRILAGNNADYDGIQVLFVDDLKITQQWVELDEDDNPSVLSTRISESVALEANTSIDDFIEFNLPIWNGDTVDGCTTTFGNTTSMPDDDPIQAITNGVFTMNKERYWVNQLKKAYNIKRQVISGSINKHIEPWRHPVYRDDQYILVRQSHDLKANRSSVAMVELPFNYGPDELIVVFDTTSTGNPDFTGGSLDIAFTVVFGGLGGLVDWGDGTVQNVGSDSHIVEHTYSSSGSKTITISSDQTFALIAGSDFPAHSGKLKSITQWGSKCEHLNLIGNDVESIDVIVQPEPSTNVFTPGYAKYSFTENNLTTADVNTILGVLVQWNITGIIYLENQATAAPPSGQGITDKETMEAAGWIVFTD